MTGSAAVARAIAADLRAGATLHAALLALPEVVDGSQHAAAVRASTSLSLGAPSARVLGRLFGELGGPAASVGGSLGACAEMGGRLTELLERIADLIERHGLQSGAGASASAGARLSARMVAGLPLVVVPFMPVAIPRDAVGLVTAIAGICLGIAGFKWISKLVPRPPEDLDRTCVLAAVMAASCRAGIPPATAVRNWARGSEASKVEVLLDWGLGWRDSLRWSGEADLEHFAREVHKAAERGLPLAAGLDRFAERRSEASRNDYESATRRAPILMVLPLVTCVLPSFGLLAIAPFVRSFFT